jgi:hypothetical protein
MGIYPLASIGRKPLQDLALQHRVRLVKSKLASVPQERRNDEEARPSDAMSARRPKGPPHHHGEQYVEPWRSRIRGAGAQESEKGEWIGDVNRAGWGRFLSLSRSSREQRQQAHVNPTRGAPGLCQDQRGIADWHPHEELLHGKTAGGKRRGEREEGSQAQKEHST